MRGLREYAVALISTLVTLVLTLAADLLVALDKQGTFIIFATGTSVTLGLALLEHKASLTEGEVRTAIANELSDGLDLYRLTRSIGDPELEHEVLALAKSLSRGEVPAHITATRTHLLYERAARYVYASNAAMTPEGLQQWELNQRFRAIVATSARRGKEGIVFSRTFVLQRSEVMPSPGVWEPRSLEVIKKHRAAGIKVRVIWAENLVTDVVRPQRRLAQNFTIFDGIEGVLRTNDVQVGFRAESDGLRELLGLREEQMKYSEPIEDYLPIPGEQDARKY